MVMIFGISILQYPRNVYSDLCSLQKILKLSNVFLQQFKEKHVKIKVLSHIFFMFFSSFLKKSELINAVWLAGWLSGWVHQIEELGRDRDFRFFAIDSVGSTIIKILDQAPLWVPELQGSKIYMNDFNNMGVILG